MKKILLTLLLSSLAASMAMAEWKMAKGPLESPWASDVTPDNVLPEYPRPQMVRENWQNLNGLWDYAIIGKKAEMPVSWDGEILVPFCAESALSGVMKKVTPEQALWYRTTVTAEKNDDERTLLHFGAVDWETVVWVNGQRVGEHRGGYDPFSFDITSALNGGENELVVKVLDATDHAGEPRGKQTLYPGGIMYTAVTGIWQTVWLETVPTAYIKGLKIVPDIDKGVVKVTVDASVDGNVGVRVKEGENVVGRARGQAGSVIEVAVPDAKLWSPDSPNLYDLEVSLGRRGDRVSSYFGMRKIEINKDEAGINRLMLNNKTLFQYGPLDQGWWPDGLYTPPTEEAIKYDLEMTKKFGMNMIRKHIKVEPARWYYWADKLGLMVWQDMPSENSYTSHPQPLDKPQFKLELQRMIDTHSNHPCIVMWVLFNEGQGQHDTESLVKWTKQYDPTRLVNEGSGWENHGFGDVSDSHDYPGPGVRSLEENRACVLGEFGGLGLPVEGHLWQADRNWGYVTYKNSDELTDAYVNLMTAMRPLITEGLCAAVYTQTTDVEIEVNGLMTYDRKVVKIDVDRASKAANKLYLAPPKLVPIVETSKDKAKTWSYTTSRPSDGWEKPGFDASSWKRGKGGFGTAITPGAVVGTEWSSSDIWARRSFELNEIPDGELTLSIHHDEDAEVYINGKLVKKLSGWTSSYRVITLSDDAAKALKKGENTLAVHCTQKTGGQFIDVGLTILSD